MRSLYLVVLLFPLFTSGQIQFESSWEDALSKSKASGKLIFLYAGTTWCEPCQEMEEYSFTDLEVANFFNPRFVNVRLDMEAYPGVALSETYAMAVFPSFLFVDHHQQVIHRGCGAMDATDLLVLGKAATADTQTFRWAEKRYRGGDRSADFMMDYLALMEDACLDAEKLARSYLETVPDAQLSEETPWEVFAAYQWDIYSREFKYLLENREVFESKVGAAEVNAKIYDTYLAQYQEVFQADELHDFGMRSLLHSMEAVTFAGADTLKLMMKLHYAEFSENWDEYADHAVALVGMIAETDPEQLNELAWKFYLFVTNKNQLKIAATWAEQAVSQLADPSVIDTYASLQFKLGNTKKALELEQKALELAQEFDIDTAHFQHQLKKFGGG